MRIRLGGFFVANAIALTGTAALMFLSYLYHFAMVRLLEPTTYGELSVLIGIITILLMPAQTIQTLIAREIAKLDAQHRFAEGFAVARAHMRGIFVRSAAGALAAVILLELAKPFYNSFVSSLQLILLFVPIWYALYVARGFLQGKEWVLAVSSVSVAEPFLKVVLAVVFVLLGWGLLGALLPIGLAALIPLLPLLWYFHTSHPRARPVPIHFGPSFKLVLATNVLLMCLLYLDLFAVALLRGSAEAGYYNVAGITSRILYFMAGGLLLVFLPKSSKLGFGQARELGWLLLRSLAFLVPAFLVFILFPHEFIFLFYTARYHLAVVPFVILSIGLFLFSAFYLMLNLLWSQRAERFALLASAAALGIDALLLALLVPLLGMVGAAISTTVASALLFVSGALYLVARWRKTN
ncbi:MAG: polysaccharide biosynthesis C-terminal domain-containing protein [Candidatus Micrarchaeia archaeon]